MALSSTIRTLRSRDITDAIPFNVGQPSYVSDIWTNTTVAYDVAEVKWVSINNLNKADIVEGHHVLIDMFNEKFSGNRDLQDRFFKPNFDGKMP